MHSAVVGSRGVGTMALLTAYITLLETVQLHNHAKERLVDRQPKIALGAKNGAT
jgi:hypothetical protein